MSFMTRVQVGIYFILSDRKQCYAGPNIIAEWLDGKKELDGAEYEYASLIKSERINGAD